MVEPLARNAQTWMWPRLAPLLLIAAHAQAQFGPQPLGMASADREIQITATASGAVSRVEVLTLGSANGDFVEGAGPSDCASANLALGGTCTQSVAFMPAAPGLRMGAVVLVGAANGADIVLGVAYLSGTGEGESSDPLPANQLPAAEQPEDAGQPGNSEGVEDAEPPTQAIATQAILDQPAAVALDGAGNMYIAEAAHNRIRMVCGAAAIPGAAAAPIVRGTTCAGAGIVSTIAGDGDAAYTGDGGPAANATLNHPGGVALDGAGNLFIADTGNNAIRAIDAVTGAISTIAGNANGAICNSASDAVGDGCPATQATLNQPRGVTVDASGNFYIADKGNNAIRFVSRTTGVISTMTVASTTTTIASTLDPSGFGQSVTFTVTVSAAAGSGSLTGTVGIADTCNGTTTTLVSGLALNASGAASFSISTLAVGEHSIVASYNTASDPAHTASTSQALAESVLEGTAVRLISSANPSAVGQSVTFTAAVTSSGGGVTPTGTIAFYDGSTVLGTPTLNASGAAIYTTSSLANGPHQIVAVYSGSPSSGVEASTSPAIDQAVQASSSIAASSSLNPSTYGVPVTFTATVASTATSPATGTVNFLDNGATIGTATLAGNPAKASFTLSTLAAGAHLIAAAYAGDASNQAGNSSASPLNQTVAQAQTVTTISAAPVSGVAGTPETFTATVELAQGSAPLAGTVDFTSGTTLLGSASLNASGVAVVSPTLAAGVYEIVAACEGSANALGSASNVLACSSAQPAFCSGSAPLLYTVLLTATQTALTVSPSTAVAGSPVAFTATVTGNGAAPTGSVNFLANGVVVGTAPLSGGAARFTDSSLPAGSNALTAEYLGNADDAISTSAGVSETVSLIPTTTALTSAATTGDDPQVTLTATVAGSGSGPEPTGTVTFIDGSAALGTAALDASGVATLAPTLVLGTNYSIDAAYSGDSYHRSSTSQTISVAGVASGFTVGVSPSTVSLSSSQNAAVTVTLTSIASFADTVTLSCASLPATVNCRFASVSLNLAAGGTASTQLTIAAGTGQAAAIDRRAGSGSFSLAGVLLPFSLAFAWFLQKLRRPNARLLSTTAILLLAAAAFAAAGCKAVLDAAATPGSYVIEVTGATTNLVRSQSLNLDIAK